MWSLVSEGGVGRHKTAGAEEAPCATSSRIDYCLPSVQMSIWTSGLTDPVHLEVAVWLDDRAAKVGVLLIVPLALQLWTQAADVWTTLLLVSWLDTVCAHSGMK